jgi:2-amino-4-hydroxy-6-hydroxymethyldihydropteridine diphosphokinase
VTTVYLSLGSNLGNREAHLRAAIARLSKLRVLRVSPVYETAPVDRLDQPWFLNLVVEAETELFPLQLLSHTSRVERDLGRIRTVPKGPRKIDIDILLYGRSVIRAARLEVPHPRMAERRFVLAPLADLAPGLRHPGTNRMIREMLADAPDQQVRRI